MKAIHFTIEPTGAGFTDQLLQFNAFYKLGLALGFRYVHASLSSERSNAAYLQVGAAPKEISTRGIIAAWLKKTLARNGGGAPDVFDFLGINKYFEGRRPTLPTDSSTFRPIVVGLSDDYLRAHELDSFESLAGHVGDLVGQFANDGDAAPGSAALVKFRLTGPRWKLFSLIQASFPRFQDGLDLPGIYARERMRAPIKSLYRKRGLKVLVHIRQGDTAVVETPWRSCMPVCFTRKDQFKEYDSFASIESAEKLFEVSEYRTFLTGLLDRLRSSSKRILVFSDGANRGLRIVERNMAKLGWSPEKAESFRKARPDYDRRQFKPFAKDPDTRLVVGEEPAKLRQLINSAIEADIVIVSTQFRMMPKLVANLCGENTPRVIVLYKRSRPVNSDIVHEHEKRFIYVDIANPDYDALIGRLRE
jgi:hypothetical protein